MKLFKKKVAPPLRNRLDQTSVQRTSTVFSYHSSRTRSEMPLGREGSKSLQSGQYLRQWNWRLLPSWLAFAAIIVSVGYILTINTTPKVTLAGGEAAKLLRDETAYEGAAREFLNSSLVNRSKITIDTMALSRTLLQQFPELEAADVTVPLAGRRPIIALTPARPALLVSTQNGLFVLDGSGRAMLSASEVVEPNVADLPVVADESGLDVEVGKSSLPQETVDFIQTLVAHLQAKQLTVESMSLPAVANELHVRLANQPYFIKFNTTTDARQSAGALLALKQRLEATSQVPAQYLDFRVEERAYYR